jgi:enoyl reductase-like protein
MKTRGKKMDYFATVADDTFRREWITTYDELVEALRRQGWQRVLAETVAAETLERIEKVAQ